MFLETIGCCFTGYTEPWQWYTESWWPSILECYLINNILKSLLWLGFFEEQWKGSVQGLASGCINPCPAGIANHPSTPPIFTRKVGSGFISNVSSLLPKPRKIRLMVHVPKCLSAHHFWTSRTVPCLPLLLETQEVSVKCRKSNAHTFMQLQISTHFRELICRSQGSELLW